MYEQIAALRLKLKIHHHELADIIKEVELLAANTKSGLRKVERKLNLRDKYIDRDMLTPKRDVRIWKLECKYLGQSLGKSITRVDEILKTLKKLKLDCIATGDGLNNVLEKLKVKMKKDMVSQ